MQKRYATLNVQIESLRLPEVIAEELAQRAKEEHLNIGQYLIKLAIDDVEKSVPELKLTDMEKGLLSGGIECRLLYDLVSDSKLQRRQDLKARLRKLATDSS